MLDLIGLARLLLDAGRLRWAAGLPEAAVLAQEFRDYRVKVSAALNESYNAREGAHDDLLLSVAVAVWAGELSAGTVGAG